MTELQSRIEELLFEGLTEQEVAKTLNLSLEEVEAQIAIIEEIDVEYFDEGDDGYALASAGFGMDEDYGYAGEDY